MNNKIAKATIFLGIIFGFFLKAGFVFATEIAYPSLFGFSVNDTSSLPEYIKYFFGVGTGLAITAAVFAIIFGGIYFLVDYGRGKPSSEGKEWIKSGLLGLVITLCAYLILYTINPNLTNLKLDGLPQIFSNDNSLFSNNPNNPEVKVYKKIPVGALAEKLLTSTIDCYDYDLNGNPIEGYKIKTDNGKELYGPTYIEHDRVDCFAKLADAADKKANIINKLAIEIKKLMDTCTCSGKCKSPCLVGKKPEQACGQPNACAGPCSECHDTAACASIKKENIQDIFSSGFSYSDDGTCDRDTRNKIEGNEDPKENGSGILIYSESGQGANQDGISYFGLKEFRSEFSNDYERIKQYVEIQPKPKVNEKELTIFNTGNCAICITCSDTMCNPADKNFDTCVKEKQKCQEEQTKCEGERKMCLKKNSPWYKLRLIDQLTYLKGKMGEIKTKIEEDKKQVQKAVGDVNSCYLIRSSAELAKIKEKTDQKITLISVTNAYIDKETNNPIGDKYCKGFSYENSSCFEYCSNICPDISEKNSIYDCYKSLPVCKDQTNKTCLENQEKEAQKCFNEKKCTLGSFEGTFAQCIASCQGNCSVICAKKYAKNSDQYNGCKTICENNSQCLLNNESQCLLNSQTFLTCANEAIDQGTAQHCLDNAYLCQYGSEQYAGYPECLKGNDALKENYAASYITENKDKQLCPEPFKVTKNSLSTCQEQNPQTAKCPASSRCPSSGSGDGACPCTSLDNTFNFELPAKLEDTKPMCVNNKKQQVPAEEDTSQSSSTGDGKEYVGNGISKITVTENNQTRSVKLKATNLVGPECSDYSYNEDPLTFYCQDNWWKKNTEGKGPNPIGQARSCSLAKEIPVGQAVDDSITWAENFKEKSDKIINKIDKIINYIKMIGQEKNYCLCDSKYNQDPINEGNVGKPICSTSCTPVEPAPIFNDAGQITGMTKPSCQPNECGGNSCQQMMDYLLLVNALYKDVKIEFSNIFLLPIADERTEVLKKITYSRTKTDECSVSATEFGKETILLNCERVLDEVVPSVIGGEIINDQTKIKNYCYGKTLNKVGGTASLDNWFCCDLNVENSTTK